MGSVNYKRGLQARISRNSSVYRHKTNHCTCKRAKTYFRRDKYFVTKRCHRKSTCAKCSTRFLQYLLPSSQKEWQNAPCDKLKAPKQVSGKEAFQNGYSGESHKLSETKRLGNYDRPSRCVLAHSNISKAQEVSKVLFSRSMLPMESYVFRPHVSSKDMDQTGFSSGSVSQNNEYTSGCLLRRLAKSESNQTSTDSRQETMPVSSSLTRIYDKPRKVKSKSKSKTCVPRCSVQFQASSGFSYRGEIHENSASNFAFSSEVCESSRFSSFAWSDGFLHRTSPTCPSFHASNTVASSLFLETLKGSCQQNDPIYTTSVKSFELVVSKTKHFEGSIIAESDGRSSDHDRCIKSHVWRSLGQSVCAGSLDNRATGLSHQCSRNGSNSFDCKTFLESVVPEISIDQNRQYNLCSVHQSTGGYTFQSVVHENLGSVELGNQKPNESKSSSCSGQRQCLGRSIEPSQGLNNGMVLENGDSAEYFYDMGSPVDGSVCVGIEPPNRDILHLDTVQQGFCNRCSINFMGKHVCICVSSDLPHSESPEPYVATPLRNHSNCTSMATSPLVHTTASVTDSMSNSVTSSIRFASSTKDSNLSPKTRTVQINSMEAIDRQFQKKGFSEQSRQLLRASWRSGTQKDYNAKFRKFNSWCSSRQINPIDASLVQVSDFLTDLFHDGLQYRTIAGYRSMLSMVLPPVDGFKIGQHPDIIRLIKGVFHSRPPQKRLVPEWDIEVVLKALQKKPFEPLKKASLKMLTFKTVFLVAISSFRRCSDLQSLRLGEGSVNVQSAGITFARHGLAKQDRESHYSARVFIPTFVENKLLDPKRSVYYYLKRTEPFRKNADGTEVLNVFLGLNEPHKPVSSQTISHWLVETLKLTLKNKNLKVKGHSTRAIGSSYALFKGASLDSILSAADWSRKSTFVKFYLRDIESKAK